MHLFKMRQLTLIILSFCSINLSTARSTTISDILDAIKELKSIQSDKLNKILLHQRELDREYQTTVDSVEDLKDEISNITGLINEKFRWMGDNHITSQVLGSEVEKIVKKIDDQERKITRVVKTLAQKVETSNSGEQSNSNAGRHSSRTERPTSSENNEVTTEEIRTQNTAKPTESPVLPPIQNPTTNKQLITYSRSQLQKLFKFSSYDSRIRTSPWSAKRTSKNDKNGAVAYTQEFSMNTGMMFNITMKVKKLTSMEIGVCTERLATSGSIWLGNSYKASVWYSGGAYFNSGKKSINWPVYSENDLITISYRPQTGTVSYLQNNDFVGAKIFRSRAESFMFCVTLYEDKDAVQIMKYYTLDYNSPTRG